jgi:ribosomal protein S11
MFLSNILKKNKKKTYNDLIKYFKLNIYIKKINTKVLFLTQKKKKKEIKNLSLICNNAFFNKPKNLIKYIIYINLSEKNTFVNVIDIKGRLKFYRSAGFVELKGKRKIKQPLALNSLINSLKSDAKFLQKQPVALHLKNINFFSYNYVRNS